MIPSRPPPHSNTERRSQVTPESSLSWSGVKEYLSDELARWFPQERWDIPKSSQVWGGGGCGGGVPKKTRYFDPKTCSQCIVVVAPYPSSLGGVYQPVKTQRETPLPMDPYRWVSTKPQPFIYLLTILFMNLHKGFVRLLCSGKIVLVLKDK